MSDIDHARNSLDAQLTSMGYVHPDTNNQTGGGYKTYSQTSDNVYVSRSFDQYATFNTKTDAKQQVQKTDVCPSCDNKAMYSCRCPVGEMMCKNNHMWYVEKNGKLVMGDPHEKDQ